MKNWYAVWDKHPYAAHFVKYYSVTLKRWMWLNGKALSSTKPYGQKLTSRELELKIPGVH